ncbi:YdaU family protein, partial [Escherichia coli]
MFYYKKNIGDYYKKTGRLSMLEHGAYTLLIDACYDRERFPTLDEALDWTWARTDAEIEAVKFILSKFFTLDGDIYVQKRIQDELDKYHAMSEQNSRIAKEREEKRRNRKR